MNNCKVDWENLSIARFLMGFAFNIGIKHQLEEMMDVPVDVVRKTE